jgi:nucleotide-binding universal stress UspA family protein
MEVAVMTYRSILVHIDNTKAAETRLAAAAILANRFECALTGVFLKSDIHARYIAADAVAPLAIEELLSASAERLQGIQKASSAARHMFDECARVNRFPFHWLVINGDSHDELVACAKRHDLAILPPEMKAAFGEKTIAASQVAMASGGPVLVLKHGGYPLEFGKRILVAWNDSRESARALRDAAPFLRTADRVDFLTVSPGATDKLDELMQRHLREHCCKFGKLVVDRSDTASVADTIRLQVGETGADLVVMGLYGHSRLQELALGGVSRDLIHDPPMPLLVSH